MILNCFYFSVRQSIKKYFAHIVYCLFTDLSIEYLFFIPFEYLIQSQLRIVSINFTKEDAIMGKRRSSFEGAMMDSNDAMRKALKYEAPDEIFLTGKLQRFVKVVQIYSFLFHTYF